MSYEITLLEADIRGPMDGSMKLGLVHESLQKAEMEYRWDQNHFTATFFGNAPSLPIAVHPMLLLQKPIAELYALKTDGHKIITDVFMDHSVTINFNE